MAEFGGLEDLVDPNGGQTFTQEMLQEALDLIPPDEKPCGHPWCRLGGRVPLTGPRYQWALPLILASVLGVGQDEEETDGSA